MWHVEANGLCDARLWFSWVPSRAVAIVNNSFCHGQCHVGQGGILGDHKLWNDFEHVGLEEGVPLRDERIRIFDGLLYSTKSCIPIFFKKKKKKATLSSQGID